MSTTEQTLRFEVLDHNIAAGYVTYIVEVWDGERNDPATEINRYLGVWRGDVLEDKDGNAFDPDWSKLDAKNYRRTWLEPEPIVWETLEQVKKSDRDALNYQSQQESLAATAAGTGYSYGSQKKRAELYEAFLEAIDKLVADPDDQAAWDTVDAYRSWEAEQSEEKVRF